MFGDILKKKCSKEEKQTYLQLLQAVTPDNDHLGLFLQHLAFKYKVSYLINSRLIQEIGAQK